MDFESAFPLRFWINLGRREDRRVETEARLGELGITAERFAAVDAMLVSERPETRIKRQERKPGARRSGNGLKTLQPLWLRLRHWRRMRLRKRCGGMRMPGDMRWR